MCSLKFKQMAGKPQVKGGQMEICNAHRSEIVYETRYCPACEEIEDLKTKIAELEKTVVKLEEDTP